MLLINGVSAGRGQLVKDIPLASCVNPSLIRAYSVNEESRIHEALYVWFNINYQVMENTG